MTSLLVVDDQAGMCESLEMLLRLEGFEVTSTTDPRVAARLMEEIRPSLVISDVRMDGLGGLELMQHARAVSPSTDFIIMTAYATVENAVQAMRLGAFDYIMKPFKNEAIIAKVRRALERAERPGTGSRRLAEHAARTDAQTLVCESAQMRQALELVDRLAPTTMPILITGETGTGKSVLARHIHLKSSRARGPFVHVNCAALPESLVESELFGHERGAFTGAYDRRPGLFQIAHEGTLFLDEIGLLPASQQPKLLLALEQRQIRPVGATKSIPVDVRIISASNMPLSTRIKSGEFRQELYYRLAAATLHLAPLRERREDVTALARLCLTRASQEVGRHLDIDAAALEVLAAYPFPGNVRELDNAMHWALAVAKGLSIGPGDLPEIVRHGAAAARLAPASADAAGGALREITRNAIVDCLAHHEGNLAEAARELGIGRTTLWRRMKEYGLDGGRRDRH
jgi:DNA-binding NtrC family response regulator